MNIKDMKPGDEGVPDGIAAIQRGSHYHWMVCFAGALVMMCTTGIQANMPAVFMPYIIKLGYTDVQAASISTMRSVASFFALFFVTKFYEKFSVRFGLVIMCALSCIASIMYAFAGSLAVYYAAAIVGGVTTAVGAFIPLTMLMQNWFREKLGEALSICAIGSGLTMIFLSPMITFLLECYGLRAGFLGDLAVGVLITVIVFCLVRNDPAEVGLKPYAVAGKKKKKEHDYNPSPMPVSILLVMLLMMFLLGGNIAAWSSHFTVYFTEVGYSAAQAALLYSLYGIFLAVGKYIYGWLYDRIGGRKSTVAEFILLGLGLVFCCMASGGRMPVALLAAALIGLGTPLSVMVNSIWSIDLSAEYQYKKNMKWFQMVYSIGGSTMTTLPGMIYVFTKDYRPVFMGLGIEALIMSVITLLVYKKMKRN